MSSGTEQHFAHVLKHGLARSNRFQVIIPLPNILGGGRTPSTVQSKTSSWLNSDVIRLISSFAGAGSAEITRGLDLMIESTELPGKNINTTDVRYNGDFYKVPYSVVYPAQQFTFRVSRDMHEKNIIDEWMNLIYDPITHEIAYLDDFSVNITINQLDEQDRVVYSVMLREAFPVSANPLTVSNEELNQFHRLTVMFMYKRWERVGENENTSLGGVSSLSQTVLGPVLAPILTNPAVKKALDIIEANAGIDLAGEAAAIYNQIDQIVKSTTGSSIGTVTSALEQIRASIEINDEITDVQKAQLLEMISRAIDAMREEV